jgi:two-component system response regulator MtrA
MNPCRVLIVDDDVRQCREIRRLLEMNGFQAQEAYGAVQAKEQARAFHPNVILAEICMAGTDGIALCKQLRADAATSLIPTVLITGSSAPDELFEAAEKGLGLGHIHKIKDFSNLLTHIREATRSSASAVRDDPEKFLIDSIAQRIWIKGREVAALPPRRFQLLCALLTKGRPLARGELLAAVWGNRDNVNVVDVTIHRLRRDIRHFPEARLRKTSDGYFLTIG